MSKQKTMMFNWQGRVKCFKYEEGAVVHSVVLARMFGAIASGNDCRL
jgi:hypothetical protein